MTPEQALRELATFCAGIIPSKFGMEPDLDCAKEITNDLHLLMERVNKVFAAYGEEARSVHVVTDKDLKYLSDEFQQGLDEWRYHIESGTEQWLEDQEAYREDNEADYRRDLMREGV